MTRPQALTLVITVALAFAGLASWGVYNYLQEESLKNKGAAGQAIVVAATELPIGTKLDITQMRTISLPQGNAPPGCASDPKTLIGRVAIRPLSQGDAITEAKLMPKEASQTAGVMTYIVPQGHRAVTVGVNEVAGVAGFIAPNNRVDVVLTTPIPYDTRGETITKIVLQNVPVLATGQITEQKEGKPVIVPTVTLDLTPNDAEILVHSSHKGSLQLLLRNVIDTAPIEARATTITTVLGGSTPAVKVAAPAPSQTPKMKQHRRAASTKPAPTRQAAPPPPARASHAVTVIDGGVRTTKEFVLQ